MIENSFRNLEQLIGEADKILDSTPGLFADHDSPDHVEEKEMVKALAKFESVCIRSIITIAQIKQHIGYTKDTIFDKEIKQYFETTDSPETLIRIMYEEVGYLRAVNNNLSEK